MLNEEPINIEQGVSQSKLDAELWLEWSKTHSANIRDKLVDYYLPFARMLAAKSYARRHSHEFEFDDYLQFAIIGLLESIERFDPEGKAAFTTFSSKRITGSILDGIANLSDRQEQINARQRLLRERTSSISENLRKGGRKDDVFERLAEIAVGMALNYLLDDTRMLQSTEIQQPENQYSDIELRQLRMRLIELVEQLPERERLLIKYNYFNQISFDTIAEMWGVSRSRTAQIHRSALDRLRKASAQIGQYDIAW